MGKCSGTCSCRCCNCSDCCCGGPRGATIFFSLVGLLLAAAVIIPPVYVHETDQNYTKLFPVLKYGRIYLESVTKNYHGTTMERYTTNQNNETYLIPPSREETYKLAIFQLLDDTERLSPYLAFISFCTGCLNVPLDLLLLGGALFRQSCGLLPWIIVTLLEHIVVGVPLIVFFGLISLYLVAQLQLYVVGIALITITITVFCLSLSSWFTVVSCYNIFRKASGGSSVEPCCYDDEDEADGCCGGRSGQPSSDSMVSEQSRRPLLANGGTQSRPRSFHQTGAVPSYPPGHPAASSRRFGSSSQQPRSSSSCSSRQLPPIPK